jgi:hypothetical protein
VRDATAANVLAMQWMMSRATTADAGDRTAIDREALTANTATRKRAYHAYNGKLPGTVSRSPEGDGGAE